MKNVLSNAGTFAADDLAAVLVRLCGWLATVAVICQFTAVLLRSAFAYSVPMLSDAALYAHSLLFLFGAVVLVGRPDGHVCIDIFSRHASPDVRERLRRTGAALLTVPFAIALLAAASPYALQSWRVFEGSAQVGGLPLVFALKSAIPLFALLLLASAVRLVLRRRANQ